MSRKLWKEDIFICRNTDICFIADGILQWRHVAEKHCIFHFFSPVTVNIMHIFSPPTGSSCMWGAAVATNYFLTHCWLALPGYGRILITSIATKITTHLQNQFGGTQEIRRKIKVCFQLWSQQSSMHDHVWFQHNWPRICWISKRWLEIPRPILSLWSGGDDEITSWSDQG